MTEEKAFDPYHVWLGIPPRDQPPHHYRLLGIELYEDNPDVIDAAANRQSSYLQTLATGPKRRESQKLLNEISAARLCLLDDQRRQEYNAQLKAQQQSSSNSDSQTPRIPLIVTDDSQDLPHLRKTPAAKTPKAGSTGTQKKETNWKLIGLAAVTVLACIIAFIAISSAPEEPPATEAPRRTPVGRQDPFTLGGEKDLSPVQTSEE